MISPLKKIKHKTQTIDCFDLLTWEVPFKEKQSIVAKLTYA